MTRTAAGLDLPPTPALHFEIYRQIVRAGARAAADAAEGLAEWEEATHLHLPLRALRQATDLDPVGIALWLSIGFGGEEDEADGARSDRRPTLRALVEAWREVFDEDAVRDCVRQLLARGLLHVPNAEAPRAERVLEIPDPIWDLLRGDAPERPAPWARYRPAADLLDASALVPIEGVDAPALVAERLAEGGIELLVLRGPERCSRRTWLGALARELGRGLLEVTPGRPDDGRWALIGPLATLLDALPVVVASPAAGEVVEIPPLPACPPPVAVLLGREGSVRTPGAERSATLWFSLPSAPLRRRHWKEALGDEAAPAALDDVACRFRMTAGNIRRAGALATAQAALASETVGCRHVGRAVSLLHRHSLDDLATPVAVAGGWSELAVPADTMHELVSLEARCRHREPLRDAMARAPGGPATCGVRALFTGPSGTGKSLATRLLAARLGIDLYRIELTVVSKFIGETERNLDRIFRVAEEQDVVLVLDEGDALLAPRTGVSTSVDRYANLETNFLLQRLESFEGILLITTNAADRIDSAFERRMDVTVAFRAPDAFERRTIWDLHLPAGHEVPPALLDELAERCVLSGGQIRNAVMHASLTALDGGGRLRAGPLEDAVRREYRKSGASCPLRRGPAALLRSV